MTKAVQSYRNDKFDRMQAGLNICPVVPVLTISAVTDALPLAQALMKAGITIIEVTLRTHAALDAIMEIKNNLPDLIVGAGTITSLRTLERAIHAGSDFIVTPATTHSLIKPLQNCPVPVFPGVATPSEALEMFDAGFSHLKFFPAESNGGVKALKSIGDPMPDIKFMPTGGINQKSAPDYLSLGNVFAVGGSWMVDKTAVSASDWNLVKSIAAIGLKICD